MHAKSLQSCKTVCDSMDCGPLSSSVRGIHQARILEWVATPFSGDFPDPRIKSASLKSPALADWFFALASPGKPSLKKKKKEKKTMKRHTYVKILGNYEY